MKKAWSLLGHYAVPLIGLQWLAVLASIISTRFLSETGTMPIAANGLAYRYYLLIWIAIAGIQMAFGIWLAKAPTQERGRALHLTTLFSLGLSLLSVFLLAIAPTALYYLGIDPHLLALLRPYFYLMAIASVFLWLSGTWRQALLAFGRPSVIYGMGILYLIAHTTIAYAFILGRWGMPALGLTGIALAECLSLILVSMLAAYFLRDHWHTKHRHTATWQQSLKKCYQLWQKAWPVSGLYINEMAAMMALTIIIAHLGHTGLAAYQLVAQCDLLFLMIPYAVSIAVGILIAQQQRNIAHKDTFTALKQLFWQACYLCWLPLLPVSLAFWYKPNSILLLFFPAMHQHHVVLLQATQLLKITAIYQLFDAPRKIAIGWCRGLDCITSPLIISLFSFWVIGVGGAWMLTQTRLPNVLGVWWCLLAAMVSGCLLMLMLIHRIIPGKAESMDLRR